MKPPRPLAAVPAGVRAPAPAAASIAALLALASGCPAAATTRAPVRSPAQAAPAVTTASAAPPRLVVLLVIDQLPAWSFATKRPHLKSGFERMLREGEWHTGEHPSAATLTAPGHALFATGEPPAVSGILGNEWYRRAHDRVLKSIEDPDGTFSGRGLRVPGLGDAIAAAGAGGKAVGVALKDRAAILPLGRTGLPIWYDRTTVAWATIDPPPPWLVELNRRAPIAAHLQDRWTADDPARLATLSGTTDDQPGEIGEKGLGPTYPHDLAATPDPAAALFAMPIANQLVLDAALAAIDGERLGTDDAADLLAISLSAHDYIGHGWGHESWEAWDMLLRLDDQLAAFLTALDERVGAGRWALALTSDHGASPLPERAGGGRIAFETLLDAANRAASTALGLGDWVAFAKYPTIYLNAAARARTPKDQQRAIDKIVWGLRAFPGLARVERTSDVAGRCETRTGDALALCLALDPTESGEVFYMPARGWITFERHEPVATAHGSLHDYDREVPLILLPPGRAAHAPLAAPAPAKVPLGQLAGVLARWLHVPPPSTLPR